METITSSRRNPTARTAIAAASNASGSPAGPGPAEVEPPSELDRRVLDLLARAGRPLSRSQLRAELHVRNERLGDALSRLLTSGAVLRHADRWAVPVPTP